MKKKLSIRTGKIKRVLLRVFIAVIVVINILPLGLFPTQSNPISVYADEIALTKTTQEDWIAGRYENKEIDVATSSGDIKLAIDLGTWNASGPANVNHAIGNPLASPSYGNSKVLKVNRFLYTFRNTAYGQFLRYDLDTREWKEMAYVPIDPYEVLDATTNGTTKIWAFATRLSRKHFLEYDITTNTWSHLNNVNDLLGQGATLEYVPGTVSYVYAFRGGSTDFYRYHLNGAQMGTWETVPNPLTPYGAATCGTYCDLVYDGTQYLYLISDSASPDRLYKYDTWSFGSAWPYSAMASNGLVGMGSDLVKAGSNFYMLATPINNGAPQQALYKYNGSTWSASTAPPYSILFGSMTYDDDAGKIIALTDVGNLMYFDPANSEWSFPLKGPPLNTYNGNSLMTTNETYIYQCRGQTTATCYTYTIGSNAWSAPITYSTSNLAEGSAMVNMNGWNYVARGGSVAFYEVNPTTGAATGLANTTGANFGAGSALVASGSSTIFALHGGNTLFRKYTRGSNTWATLAPFPETAGRGAGMAKMGDFIYGTSGNFRGRFYRYSETANSWTEMASIPVAVYNGGAMTSDGSRYIYLQSGGDNDITGRYFYRYDVLTNMWQRMADTPNMVRYGGGIASASGSIYSYQGYNKALWKYTPPQTHKYVYSGTWYSPEYDLGYASSFTAFSSSFSPADGVDDSVLFYVRSSSNKNTWSGWEPSDSISNLPAGKYAQVKVVLKGKTDGSVSPTVDSFTFGYNDDSTAPVVTGLNLQAYNSSLKAITLTSGETYNYRNPYFEWNTAVDAETGVEGYYVYFGDQSGYDPVTYGSFQKTTNYTVSSGMVSGTTYYLKIKAINNAGYSTASTDFSFEYSGISPVTTATITSQSDWDDAQATKSAVNTSSSGWWNQTYQYRKQLTISPTLTATAGSTIRITADTGVLVAEGKLRSDRKDWRIIFNNGTTWEELDRQYVNATTTYFPLKRSVNAGTSDTNYYIYYGNPNETTEPTSNLANTYSASKWGGVSAWFDGTDYVRFNNSPAFINGLSQLTIEGWFKYQNTYGIRSLYGGNAIQQTAVNIPSGQNYLQYQLRTTASGTVYSNNGTGFLVPNTWNHFALVYNATTGIAQGFLNGRLDFTRSGLTGTVVASQYQYLGYNNTNGGYMYGYLDEFRISNTARYTTNFIPQTTSYDTDVNTLGLYHFDDGSGQTCTDSSVNGNNGMVGSTVGVDANDPTWIGFVTAVPGTESTVPVSTNTNLKLQYSSNGSWANSRLPSLPWGTQMQYGASIVANNALYVLRGYNTVTFYKLDFATSLWTQLADLPAAAYNGAAMGFDGTDSIYIIRGNGTADFYKYSISNNSYTTSPTLNQPANPFTTGTAITKGKDKDGFDVFYFLRGGTDDFLTYYLSGPSAGTWVQRASLTSPFTSVAGSGLVYDSSRGVVWMLGGNLTFAKYTISTEVWDNTVTAPALPPYYFGYSSNNLLMYGNNLYAFTSFDIQANNESKNYIWKYNTTANTWENIQTSTEFWTMYGAVAYDGSRYAYLIMGESTGQTAIARFDLQNNSHYPETPPLPQDRLYTSNGERITHAVSTGTALAYDNDDFIYMAQGGTSYVNRYQISTKRWTQLPNQPCQFYGNLVHTGTDLYSVCSSASKKLYRYDQVNKQWKELADAPDVIGNAGSQGAVYDGSGAIYVLRGYNTPHLYKYTIGPNDTGSWTIESTTIPANIGNAAGANALGASMTFYQEGADKYLYIFRGYTTYNNLYRYKIGTSTQWTNMALVPDQVYQGSGSVLFNGKIYVTTGLHNVQMYVYDIATDTYSYAPNAQSFVNAGGAMVKGKDNSMYILQGNSQYTFWKYNLPSATTSFVQSGVYVTKPIELDNPYSFAGLSVTVASPSATAVEFETRTSDNLLTWSDWSAASGKKVLPSNEQEYNINSAVNQYIQVRVTLTSDEGMFSPTVSNLRVNYYADSTPPTNPTTVDIYTSSSRSATLLPDKWYNNAHPYFEWSGATDGTGSGVAGYYVYFDTDPDADASISGQLVSVASYSATLKTDGTEDGEYYLKIKTVDYAGNINPNHYIPVFKYLYDSTAPETIATENISVLPNGYTATNYFTFSWLTTDDPLQNSTASGLMQYEYKTGTSSGLLSQYQPYVGECPGGQCSVAGITAYREDINTFYLRTKDNAGNTSAVTPANFSFNTMAPSAPRNVAVDTSQAAANKFSFTWDQPSTFRGTIKEYRYSIGEPPTSANISTTSARIVNNIKGIHDGDNLFYVVAVDDANNVSYLHYASKVFSVSVTAPGIPLSPEAFDNSIRSTQQYRVGLTWDAPTDKGTSFDRYEVYASETEAECSTEMTGFTLAGSTAGTSYVATSIGETALESKEYYFCITACATTNQCSSPSTTISMTPTGRWLTAPELVGTQSATVKTKSALIQWSTNRTANTFVKYGTSPGDYGAEVGSSNQVTAHDITLTELKPGTQYYYKMLWSDEDGNLGESDELSFVTNSAPLISGVKPIRLNINSAEISFTISNAIQAKIEYGKTTAYDSQEIITTSKTESTYTVLLSDLIEGTIYHYRIVGEDDEGNTYNGDDYTFETLPTPKILGLRVQQVIGMPTSTLRLLWSSNTLISSVVTYYPTVYPERALDQISLVLKKNHEVIIKNLMDNTDYTILIKGKDSANNEAKMETRTLKTASDIRSPEIQNMNVESTIVGVGDTAKAQIVVSWDTDEPATTQVEYGQGTGTTYNQTTQEDTNLTTNHIVTITGLTPSKIYHLRANSKDKASNLGQSFDTVVITPKSTKDALNLVIDNLSKTFGFLKNTTLTK